MNHLLSLIALSTFSGTVQSCWKSSDNVLPTTIPTSQLKETNVKNPTLREDFKDPYEVKNSLVLSLESFRAYWNISSTTKGEQNSISCSNHSTNLNIENKYLSDGDSCVDKVFSLWPDFLKTI